MSDSGDNSNTTATTATTEQKTDSVHELLHGSGQHLTTEQRNDRREALLKRQREARERSQQLTKDARANAAAGNSPTSVAATIASTTTNTNTSANATPAPVPVAATVPAVAVAPVDDAPVRENMVQQAVSFLSSPSVQSADDAKKVLFLEKKGLTRKEIDLAKARVAGSAPSTTSTVASQPQQQTYQPAPAPVPVSTSTALAPPPIPPRTYAQAQPYPQPIYYPQQQVAPVDPNAFKRKILIAMLISGGVTALAGLFVQKAIYPLVRGITGARQNLAVSQTELLNRLKEKLLGYKEHLLSLHLGSNRRPQIKKVKDTKTVLEEVDELTKEGSKSDTDKMSTTESKSVTITTTTVSKLAPSNPSTIKQLDEFSKKLEKHSNNLNFEELKATRSVTQDLAEYITKETYALTSTIAYSSSRYQGYGMSRSVAGKGVSETITPESSLKQEIVSLKGLLLSWRNFPVSKEGAPNGLPNLVQQQ